MDEKKNILKDKSFRFAVRTYKLYTYLTSAKNEFVLSKQLLRSGTSIGANVREAYNASSKPDFIHKLSIAQKEADETIYWLELMHEVKLLSEEEFESIKPEAIELLKLIRSSIMTAKKNLNVAQNTKTWTIIYHSSFIVRKDAQNRNPRFR